MYKERYYMKNVTVAYIAKGYTLGTRVKRWRKSKADLHKCDTIKEHRSKADSTQSFFFPNPLWYLTFTFTCIAFVEIYFTISGALYACAQCELSLSRYIWDQWKCLYSSVHDSSNLLVLSRHNVLLDIHRFSNLLYHLFWCWLCEQNSCCSLFLRK